MAANPQRRTPLPKDLSDPVALAANPPFKPPNRSAVFTRVGCGLCFGAVQLSCSTSTRCFMCRGQWSLIATQQLSLVYNAVRPKSALCVQL